MEVSIIWSIFSEKREKWNKFIAKKSCQLPTVELFEDRRECWAGQIKDGGKLKDLVYVYAEYFYRF